MATEMVADFKAYQEQITASLVNVTRNASAVASADLSFHRSTSDRISKSLDSQNAHLLRLTNKLIKAATKETNIKIPVIQDQDSIDDNWKRIVDVIDDLLEKADANLDEVNGGITRLTPQPSSPSPAPANLRTATNRPYASPSFPKPQLYFESKVDNYETGKWKPLLRSKPHAKVSLETSVGSEDTGYRHPYAHEIEQYKYPASVYQDTVPIPYTRPERSEPIWVDTEKGVLEMLQELKTVKEIAIDLEHNDKNSYLGLVSLMQISTRNKDWVVDTLKPWRDNLQILNHVFADPSILKVFHGATSDMIWLQRDLGLYVVGLFDTYHAANALGYPQRSLAFLLEKFANFQAQKQYQLADWRVRPLPTELLDYARSDTHYLLYIYDNMRNELIRQTATDEDRHSTQWIDYVLENSKKEALQVYERHVYDRDNGLGSDGWLKLLLSKNMRTLDKQQFGVLKALHEWRDQKARELDEGVHSIMSNVYLFGCAEFMPTSTGGLYGNRAIGKASLYVSRFAQEIVDAIKRGKREGLEGDTVQEVMDRNADKLATFRQFRHANPNAKPQDVQQSIAATMQKLVQNGEIQNGLAGQSSTTEPLVARSSVSSLWGAMQHSTASPSMDATAVRTALKAIMPLQSFVDTSTSQPNVPDIDTSMSDAVPSKTDGEVRIVQEPDIDVPFTLREGKKKRPVDEIEAEDDLVLATTTDDGDKYAVTDEGQVQTYSKRRAAFKKARPQAEETAQTNFQPFDYANAQSVLHPAPEPLSLSKDSRPDKPFNPFAKAQDAPNGAKRSKMGKELAGKSHTFKS